jgi:LPXTG-motif cell wall-anchored protein
MTKKKGIIAVVAGSLFASLGAIGTVLAGSVTCVACLAPAFGYLLAVLGVIGISIDVLTAQNVVFSLIGVGLLGTGIYFIRRKQTCAVKKRSKKK